MNFIRLARPFIFHSRVLYGVGAAAGTVATFGFLINNKVKNDQREADRRILDGLSFRVWNNESRIKFPSLQIDPVEIGKSFTKACEKGDFATVDEITLEHKINFPSVNLSHIPANQLNKIVDKLLDRNVKKIAVEDFEWALLHKKYEFYEILLKYLNTEKKQKQLAISELPEGDWFSSFQVKGQVYEHAFEGADKIYASYECILEHPRIKPYKDLARAYHDQHEGKLLEQCQKEMEEIQGLMNEIMGRKLSIDELCKLDKEMPDIEDPKRGDIEFSKARDQLIVLKKLLDTKDYSSLHWLFVNDQYWKPPASGVGPWS